MALGGRAQGPPWPRASLEPDDRRALAIPRVMHRREQLVRAETMAGLGLVTLLRPDEVTPERLHPTVTGLLADPDQPLTRARARAAALRRRGVHRRALRRAAGVQRAASGS